MPALQAIFGGNANPAIAELNRLAKAAQKTKQFIQSDFGAGTGGVPGAPIVTKAAEATGHLKTGAARESLVLLREIGRGNWSRVPGSFALLLQYTGQLGKLIHPITGAVIGLGVGFAAAYYHASKLIDRFSGFKMPEFHPEYIAKHLQKVNQVYEAQLKITNEIYHSIEAYNSAEKAAERIADRTKTHFEHLKQMNEYAKQEEMARARSVQQRMDIEAKYAEKGLALSEQQRAATESNERAKADALEKEQKTLQDRANSILKETTSKEQDEEVLKQRKAAADKAQKELDEDKAKNTGGLILADNVNRNLRRAANKVSATGISDKEFMANESRWHTERLSKIAEAKTFEDQVHGRDVARKQAEELVKQAGEAGSKAAVIRAGLGDRAGVNSQASKDERETAAAKLRAEQAQMQHPQILRGHLTNLQKVGAYSSAAQVTLVNINKSMDHKLGRIENLLAKEGAASQRLDAGNVSYGH